MDYIDDILDAIVNAGGRTFAPGQNIPSDRSRAPMQVVYDKACNLDFEASALWLGLVAMQFIIDRPEKWIATKT